MKQKTARGFTLIELLVVISIIGILAALTLTGFNAARKNARDATRKSDLQQYRSALEAYASNNNGKYPIAVGGGYQDVIQGDGNANANGVFTDAGSIINEYLPTAIKPPIAQDLADRDVYRYLSDSTGIAYTLLTGLETGYYWQVCSTGKAGKPVNPCGNCLDSVCDIP